MSIEDRERTWLRKALLADEPDGQHDSNRIPSNEIWGAVQGELSPSEVGKLLDKAVVDPDLAMEWELARELSPPVSRPAPAMESDRAPELAPPGFDPSLLSRTRGAMVGMRRYLVTAAAGAMIFMGLVWSTFRAAAPVYRGSGVSIESLVPEDVLLPRNRVLLRWTPGAQSETFNVRISTDDLDLQIEVSSLTEPEYLVPEAELVSIPDGRLLVWQVELVHSDGTRDLSPAFRNRIGTLREDSL